MVTAAHYHYCYSNDTARLSELRADIERLMGSHDISEHIYRRVLIAADEAMVNIIEHAFPGIPCGQGVIDVHVSTDADGIELVFEDPGHVSFLPDQVPTIDIAAHVAAGRQDGLGRFLMTQCMDEVRYEHDPGSKSQLYMRKAF